MHAKCETRASSWVSRLTIVEEFELIRHTGAIAADFLFGTTSAALTPTICFTASSPPAAPHLLLLPCRARLPALPKPLCCSCSVCGSVRACGGEDVTSAAGGQQEHAGVLLLHITQHKQILRLLQRAQHELCTCA